MTCKRRLTYSVVWTADELNFVDIIKKYPRLYAYGTNKKSVNDLWDAVSLEYGEPVEVCKKRWLNMKIGYNRQRKKMEQPERGRKSKYLDGTLSFLDDYMAIVGDSRRKRKKKSNTQDTECLPSIEDETLEPKIFGFSNGSFTMMSASDKKDPANNPCQFVPNIEPSLISTPKSLQITNIKRINPIQEQKQRTQTTTVLTQDIIGYILKSKSDEKLQSNDLFQSIASVVSDQVLPSTNMIQTNTSNAALSPFIQDSKCTIQQAIPLRQATYVKSNLSKSDIGLSNDSNLKEGEEYIKTELHDEEHIEDIIIKEEIYTETNLNNEEYVENEITIEKSDNKEIIGSEIIKREIKEEKEEN